MLIQSAADFSVQHGKKGLLKLMHEFRKNVGEEFPNNVLELGELVDVYLLEEFLEKEP